VFYRSTQFLVLLVFKVVYRLQARYLERMPTSGGALICPNHLSNLDPMVVGCVSPRRVNFLAKKSLFAFRPFGAVLYALECIPIDRQSTGIAGMKETLRRLKLGESVLMFPEGERSMSGELLPVMPGFTALVKRVQVPLVPIGIHGTYEAWPRAKALPWIGRVKMVVGHPIDFSEIFEMNQAEMAKYLEQRIAACYEEARCWNLNS
jgi:1-acyl-sn-glycerol-3-phosphate acyltransferase